MTTKSLQERFYYHTVQSKQNSQKMAIAKSILKYGEENFEIRLLEECTSKRDMIEKEKYWIKKLETYKNGYNMTLGGEGLFGYSHSLETRIKMSKSKIGNKNNKGHFKGRNHTEEAKFKISRKNSGINNGMFGKTHSEIAKAKIIESQQKKVAQYKDKKLIKIYGSYKKAAYAVGGKPAAISRCCRGIRKHHRGYEWRNI